MSLSLVRRFIAKSSDGSSLTNVSDTRPWTDNETAALVSLANAYPLWAFTDLAVCFSEDYYPDADGQQRDSAQCLLQIERLRSQSGNENVPTLSDTRPLHRGAMTSKMWGAALNKLYMAKIIPSQDPTGDNAVDALQFRICKACRTFQRGYWTDGLGAHYGGMKHPANVSIQQLRESSQQCTCCRFMLQNLEYPMGETATSARNSPLTMSNVNYNIGLYVGRRQWACFSLVHLHDWRPLDGRYLDLSFQNKITREQDSFRRTISHIIGEDSSCAALCMQIRTWLRKCSRHLHCPRDGELPLPDRILEFDLQNVSRVRLKEKPFGREKGLYVALSYCWGRHGQYLLTNLTHDTLIAGLELSLLPRTIQDAIEVTRTLGYSYIWIDALCILQDSAADWEQQSSKMGSIYGNAHLTLIASNAADVTEGFLRPRSNSETYCGYHEYKGRKKPLYLSNPFRGFDGYPAFGRMIDPGLDDEKDWRSELEFNETSMRFVADEPLTSRGWTAQERELSIRKVYFGSKQMFWECQTCLLLENGFRVRDRSIVDASSKPAPPHTVWARAVELYSSCKLTRVTDRLPAISGVAGEIARIRQDQYLAGHFYRMLMLSSLIWELKEPRVTTGKHEYLAPSWSWASQEHAIQYPHVEGKLWSFEAVGKVLAHSVIVKGYNPYGEVAEGWLDVRAPALCTTVGQLPEKTVEYRDGIIKTIKDHARKILKDRFMALTFTMKRMSASNAGHTIDVEVKTSFTLDYVDLQHDVPAIFFILSCRTNATRRRDLQRLQPNGSYIRHSTFGGIVVTPTEVESASELGAFRRIGVFYEMTAALPDELDFVSIRLV